MDETVLKKLAGLPPLGGGPAPSRVCKICGAAARPFDVVDFNKFCDQRDPYRFGYSGIPVYYYRCVDCEFLFTDFADDWSEEDFKNYIYNDDYIKVDGDYAEARPRRDAQFFADLLRPYPGLSLLDYGGGAGVLAAALREEGFDAECYDPFSSPARPERRFGLITCMEVIEHSPDPIATLRDMGSFLEPGGCILVGTGLQPDDIETLRTGWWYVGPRNGHVSLQSAASLIPLARAAGLIAYRGGYLHGFAASPSDRSAALLARIGRPAVDLLLGAPDAEGSAGPGVTCDLADWHGIEDAHLRWTAQSEVAWHWTPPWPRCDVEFRFPFIMEIAPGFVAGAQLHIDGQGVSLHSDGRTIKARASLESEAPVTIRLVTPPPPTPQQIYGSADLRHLGIAFPVYGARRQGEP